MRVRLFLCAWRLPGNRASPACLAAPYLAIPYALLSTSYALFGLAILYPLAAMPYWTPLYWLARATPSAPPLP